MTPLSSILIAFLVIIALAIISLFFFKTKKKKVHDHRSELTPNDTNYNIASHNPELIKNATPAEARKMIEQYQKGDLSSLAAEDFYLLKEKIKESSK